VLLIGLSIVSLVPGCLPPDEPAKKPKPVDDLVHTWIVADHILGKGSSLTPAEAVGFHGRTIEITLTGYTSPWQGSCDEASRTTRKRTLTEVVDALEISPSAEGEATAFGLTTALTEYRLACNDQKKPPPLLVYTSNGKAMTCFNAVCYLMKQF
jgi:hypothetical protein